ncbi:hypothetical protein [Streptomyces sp. NL15-2K]|uniref:hypothetical protein n=1 Tax=Streptomyces sp. NL15-2K TaxID=376149 RepID=UPI000F5809BA|nr:MULTISPECIES: hypothetical protein [Actinomycetes]WKX13070.1 hypothetical protein Q4V64_38315 [Kutzneria buriramensis]GCB45605.1 hypothetical protein SNL152K_2896 [Streptomyces sp. NL15-2K]
MILPDDELSTLVNGLSHELRVYVRAGRLRPTGELGGLTKAVAEEVHALVVELHESYWHQYSDEAEPAPASQIEMSLYSMSPAEATALMAELASKDLAFDQFPFTDPAEAEAIAERVVGLLGPEARWWSNWDDGCVDGVTGCTFDGLVVGSDGDRFAVLIQVADD